MPPTEPRSPSSPAPLEAPPAGAAPRDRLVALLARESARRGHFVLSSGRTSSLYVDARLTTMHPEGLVLVGPLGLAAMRDAGWAPDAVGGLTLGADPVAYAVVYASALAAAAGGLPSLRGFTVRKAPKAHGTGQRIEGPFAAGDRVVIVEDVITTGGSALQAIEAVRAAGGIVVGVLAVVDREEGGREAIMAAAGVPVLALARAAELVALLPDPPAPG